MSAATLSPHQAEEISGPEGNVQRSNSRDSGTFYDDVVTTQPTPYTSGLRSSSDAQRKLNQPDTTTDRCCMIKAGFFKYGFSDETPFNPSKPSSKRQSVISADTESGFYSGRQSFSSTTRTQLVEERNTEGGDTSQIKDNSYRHNLYRKKSLAAKRGSFLRAIQETKSQEHSLTGSHHSVLENEDNVSDLDFILQCIKESQQRSGIVDQELIGRRVELDNFAAIYIGKGNEATKLSIPGTGVSLYIPPLAVFTEEPKLVYIYSPNGSPNFNSEEKWVTPIIECGPSGMKFTKPVFLTLPYKCPVNESLASVSAYHSKRFQNAGDKWKGLRNGYDTVIIPSENEVTLLLDNFCKFGCTVPQEVQDASTKWMQVAVVVNQDEEEGDKCSVEVQLCDLDKVNSRGFKSQGAASIIHFNNDGGAVNVFINEVHRSWKLCTCSIQQLPCDRLWSTDSPLTLTFDAVLKASADYADFKANVDIYQDDNDQPRRSIRATTQHGSSFSQAQERATKRAQTRQTIDEQFLATTMKKSRYFKRQQSHQFTCTSLDTALEHNGWKQLASEIGFQSVTTVDWMDHYSKQRGIYSPSAVLIDFYMKDATEENIVEKLQRLSNHLAKIGNEDAKRHIDEEIEQRQHNKEHASELREKLDILGEERGNDLPREDSGNSVTKVTGAVWKKARKSLTSFSQFVATRAVRGMTDDQPNIECVSQAECQGEDNPGFSDSGDIEDSECRTIQTSRISINVTEFSDENLSYEECEANNNEEFLGAANRKISTQSHDSGVGASRPNSAASTPQPEPLTQPLDGFPLRLHTLLEEPLSASVPLYHVHGRY